MIAIGIDVSKGKSTVAACKPYGEIVLSPFDVQHTPSALKELADSINALDGEVRIVLEHTGKYYQPIARHLFSCGFFVSVVNPKLIHDFGNNTIRKVKTDKADALKIANYALANWQSLTPYSFETDTRLLLKTYCRQYYLYLNQRTCLKNNLISILDQTFPECNTLFTSRKLNGDEKWIDFSMRFWHRDCVAKLPKDKFIEVYNRWCKNNDYRPNSRKAASIHEYAKSCVATLPYSQNTKALFKAVLDPLIATCHTMSTLLYEMNNLASQLPEYPVVIAMPGVGRTLCPQLIAEIGDIHRFSNKHALIAYAGIDAPPFQSGTFNSTNRTISKRGSANLRRVVFNVMQGVVQRSGVGDPVYEFIQKKRSEGKPYYVCLTAGSNKFLRIYYGRVKEYLDEIA